MLFTVDETAYILNVKPRHIYYIFSMCQVDGAMKVLDCWRIDEASLVELYERINGERAQLFTFDSEYEGFRERLEAVKAKFIQDCARPDPARIQGRARLECVQSRFDRVAGTPGRAGPVQLELFADGFY